MATLPAPVVVLSNEQVEALQAPAHAPERMAGRNVALSLTLTGPLLRAVEYAEEIGMPFEELVKTAIHSWVRSSNIGHIVFARQKAPAVPKTPRPVGRPPKTPKPPTTREMERTGMIGGLLRNETAKLITFEVVRPGTLPTRTRFTGWEPAIDVRIQLAPFVSIAGMAAWDDLVGRTVSIKGGAPDADATFVMRPAAEIAADLEWLAGQLADDEADRAALQRLREMVGAA